MGLPGANKVGGDAIGEAVPAGAVAIGVAAVGTGVAVTGVAVVGGVAATTGDGDLKPGTLPFKTSVGTVLRGVPAGLATRVGDGVAAMVAAGGAAGVVTGELMLLYGLGDTIDGDVDGMGIGEGTVGDGVAGVPAGDVAAGMPEPPEEGVAAAVAVGEGVTVTADVGEGVVTKVVTGVAAGVSAAGLVGVGGRGMGDSGTPLARLGSPGGEVNGMEGLLTGDGEGLLGAGPGAPEQR